MATATGPKPSKSAFRTDFYKSNPKASFAAANEAWTKAGNPGNVSQSLVGTLCSDLGRSGNIRPTPQPSVPSPTKKKPKAGKEASKSKGKGLLVKEVLFDDPKLNAEGVNRGVEVRRDDGDDQRLTREQGQIRPGSDVQPSTRGEDCQDEEGDPENRWEGIDQWNSLDPSSVKKRRPGNRDRILAEVEGKIDRLIFDLLENRGTDTAEDALSVARRVGVRAQKA